MSQLSSQLLNSISPNQAPGAPRIGVTESLNAPGLSVAQPYSSGAALAAQLLSVLGGAGNVIEKAGGLVEQQRREREREQAKAEQSLRGAASLVARTDAPEIVRQIQSGELPLATDITAGEFADAVASAKLPPGQPFAYADEYRRILEPAIAEAVANRVSVVKDTARKEGLATLAQRAIGSPDQAGIESAFAEAKDHFGKYLTEDQIAAGVVLPALQTAAAAGDSAGFNHAAAVLGDRFGADVARLRNQLQGQERQNQAVAQDGATNAVLGELRQGAPVQSVLQRIDAMTGQTIDEERAKSLRQVVVGQAQAANVNTLRSRILNATITPDEVGNQVRAASQLAPTDPGYIPAETGSEILNQATRAVKFNLAEAQVKSVLLGAPGYLNGPQHNEAFTKTVGPEGAGFIDATGHIASPPNLAGSILAARIIPPAVRDTVLGNLTGDDAGDIANAAQVVGAIGNSSPRLYAQLLDAAGPNVRPVLDAAVTAYQRGQLDNPIKAAKAIQSIRAARDAKPELPAIDTDIAKEIKAASSKPLETVATDVLDGIRRDTPQAVDRLLGLDYLNPDPTSNGPSADVAKRVEGWVAQRYTELRNRLPAATALDAAKKYADAQARNSIDFVRWDGSVTPVLIDKGEGLRLPENLRWAPGFDDEARADLTKAGHDPADVVTLRPYTDPTAAASNADPLAGFGWVFVDHFGDPIRDDAGKLILYRPSAELTDRTAAGRKLFDDKAAAYIPPKSLGESLAPVQYPGEPSTDYGRRIGRKRPGEL